MVRSELIARLKKQHPELTGADITKAANTIFGQIMDTLARGDRVEIRGFGVFVVVVQNARKGLSPQTGLPMQIEEKRVIRFKAGKGLRERLIQT